MRKAIAIGLVGLGVGACGADPVDESVDATWGPSDGPDTMAMATSTTAEPTGTLDEGTTSSATTADSTAADSTSVDSTGAPPLEPDVPADGWQRGPAPLVLPGPSLWPLPDGATGPALWVSNNPERFTGTGWLQQHARNDAQRGGAALPVEHAAAYLFHLNGSGATRTVHLVATNPQAQAVTLDARGLLTTNAEHPIGMGSGPSVAVAAAWLADELPLLAAGTSLDPLEGVVLASATLGPGGVLDGRVEVEASAGIYLYSVVTTGADPGAAINATQGDPAPGDLAVPGPNAFGRMAGVYETSEWVAEVTLEVPPPPAHTGLMLNTSDKFAYDDVVLQDQTATALVHLSDSSEQTHGNYGMRYALVLRMCATPGASEVRVAFGHHVTSDADVPSFTYNGDARIGDETVAIFTTPTEPRQVLADVPLPGEGCAELPVELYVPGLITIGHQLSFESR